jgi:hypothetical protein
MILRELIKAVIKCGKFTPAAKEITVCIHIDFFVSGDNMLNMSAVGNLKGAVKI